MCQCACTISLCCPSLSRDHISPGPRDAVCPCGAVHHAARAGDRVAHVAPAAQQEQPASLAAGRPLRQRRSGFQRYSSCISCIVTTRDGACLQASLSPIFTACAPPLSCAPTGSATSATPLFSRLVTRGERFYFRAGMTRAGALPSRSGTKVMRRLQHKCGALISFTPRPRCVLFSRQKVGHVGESFRRRCRRSSASAP